jgi:TrmH family RNA methyltransferase
VKRVVLVRPSGPRNVGMIVRVCANFGPVEIRLVAPERPSLLIHPEFEQMAHGVPDMRERCVIVSTLEEALADCTASIGFTARSRGQRRREDWRALREVVSARANDDAERVALVFGNEVTGLEQRDTVLLQELVHIATSPEHSSLNLAMAVGVVLSDLFTAPRIKKRERPPKLLSGDGREYLKADLKHVFGDKVALTASAREDILEAIERVFSRAPLEDRDARAWHLMARALGSTLTPKDLGLKLHDKRGRRRAAQAKARARIEPLDAG